jgi:thymidine phosphorylase
VVHMGGGRLKGGERIDPSVGYSEILELGTRVVKGQPLARLHAASERAAQEAEKAFLASVEIGEAASPRSLIVAKVG